MSDPKDIDVENIPPTKSLYFENYLDLSTTAKVLKIAIFEYAIQDEENEENHGDTQETEKISAYGVILDQSNISRVSKNWFIEFI